MSATTADRAWPLSVSPEHSKVTLDEVFHTRGLLCLFGSRWMCRSYSKHVQIQYNITDILVPYYYSYKVSYSDDFFFMLFSRSRYIYPRNTEWNNIYIVGVQQYHNHQNPAKSSFCISSWTFSCNFYWKPLYVCTYIGIFILCIESLSNYFCPIWNTNQSKSCDDSITNNYLLNYFL